MLWKLELLFAATALSITATSLQVEENATNTETGCVFSQINMHLTLAAEFVERAKMKVPKDLNGLCKSETCLPERPRDCSDIYKNGYHEDGAYDIFPLSRIIDGPLRVYCDMSKDGGGWTVIQRRGDFGRPTDYFFRDWNSYKTGFGDIWKDFWIGNDNIFALTNQRIYKLQFDLADWDGDKTYAKYDEFWISDDTHSYTLHVQGYSGTAGDSFSRHHGYNFTTKDRDNDVSASNCAESYKGAWWYISCHDSNLNGLYHKGEHSTGSEGVNWRNFKGTSYSLKDTVMKIRPAWF